MRTWRSSARERDERVQALPDSTLKFVGSHGTEATPSDCRPGVDVPLHIHSRALAQTRSPRPLIMPRMDADVAVQQLEATGRKRTTAVRCIGYAALIQAIG
jgi:hypothetical protein